MTVNYSGKRPSISLVKSEGKPENRYDHFPPLLFCRSEGDFSCRYLRAYYNSDTSQRDYAGVINADHPYMVWLLNNAERLDTYFNRQFQQIVDALCWFDGFSPLISTINDVRAQLLSFKERHGIDMSQCPELSEKDFLMVKDEKSSADTSLES